MSDSIVEYADEKSVVLSGIGLELKVFGVNNRIYIGKNVRLSGLTININSNNNSIHIGDGCAVSGSIIMKISDGNRIIFGERTSVGGANFICGEGREIKFGKDCMIAWGIEFRTTDSHGIFDLNSRDRVNYAGDISIGDHVWIAAHSIILKNSNIKNGCVVALRSVVSGSFPDENCVIAGLPAKIIKNNIYWERELLG